MDLRHYPVHWSQTAMDDLMSIVEFIARDSEAAALQVAASIQERAATLQSLPHRGRLVPDLEGRGLDEYRELLCSPWRIVYEVKADEVLIHAIVDARRSGDKFPLGRLLGQKPTAPWDRK